MPDSTKPAVTRPAPSHAELVEMALRIGTLAERRACPKAALRVPTLHRARYVAEHVFSFHSCCNTELSVATAESIGMVRRCSGMLFSHGYVRILPSRRFQAVSGAAETFEVNLAAEHDRIRRRGALLNQQRRAEYHRGRLSETGETLWADRLAQAEQRIERLQHGESVRAVLAS